MDATDATKKRALYRGYVELAAKLPTGQQEIFERIEVVAPCIRYALTQMLAWQISRRMPRGPWGDWFIAEEIIQMEFLIEEIDFLAHEIFSLLALKCVFLGGYEHLRACYNNLPCLYEAAALKGYVDDARAVEIMLELESEQMAFLSEFTSQISSRDMDFLFYLGGEVERLLKNYEPA